jgi:predicted AAA+ superfamily ATPase
MTYWRSLSQFEVDLLVGDKLAIEVKATSLVQDKHLRGLRALKQETIFSRYIVVSMDSKIRKTEDGIEVLPWKKYVELLWAGDLI